MASPDHCRSAWAGLSAIKAVLRVVFVCTGLTFGLGWSTASLGLAGDADEPIVIRADGGQFDQKTNRATYRGNVQVDQGTLRVNADKMEVDRKDQKVTRITFYGTKAEPARYQQQLNPNEGKVKARANRIVYHTQQEVLDLEGRAFLTQQGNEVAGDKIRYDIVAGKVNADSNPNSGPINVVIQPDGTISAQR